MAGEVKTRTYSSPVREERAARTRAAVLAAARDLFRDGGFAETQVSDIAARAGVSVDTVYASVGRKPQLLLAVLDMALADDDEPLPAEQRDYVRAIHAAGTAEEKIDVYAAALGRLLPRTAPLLRALREAGATDPECTRTRRVIDERRAGNLQRFARELRSTGRLRADLDDEAVADLVWATGSPEYYELLAARGWDGQRCGRHLADLWRRLLLRP